MIFSRETLAVGGLIATPDSFVSKEPGEIIGLTNAGIQVLYQKKGGGAQQAFYSYDWLNQQYGNLDSEPPDVIDRAVSMKSCDTSGRSDMDDAIPF